MFKWFNRNKSESKEIESKEIKKIKPNNYDIDDNGNITVNIVFDGLYGFYNSKFTIRKELIISHSEKSIVFYNYENWYNHQTRYGYSCWGDRFFANYNLTIENKENFIEYKETQIKTLEYCSDDKGWKFVKKETEKNEAISKRTPLDVFEKEFNSKYKLIETVDELNDYLSSSLDCDTWCRKKLYDKMKELGLGDGFINQFADLVGNNLDKYHAMIDLANEVSDKDTLMYLYTYKFR